MKNKSLIMLVLVVLVLVGGAVVLAKVPDRPGNLETFATCLKDKGATFYGAFWCPHCHEQKGLFGRSQKTLPYFECSTPNGKEQTQTCIEKEIKTYPTWIFADGTKETGVLSLEKLALKTSCPLVYDDEK